MGFTERAVLIEAFLERMPDLVFGTEYKQSEPSTRNQRPTRHGLSDWTFEFGLPIPFGMNCGSRQQAEPENK